MLRSANSKKEDSQVAASAADKDKEVGDDAGEDKKGDQQLKDSAEAAEKPKWSETLDQSSSAAAAISKCSLSEKFTLRSHMDGVRGLHFVPGMETMASISEDCMVKLWNLADLESKYTESEGNVEPYMTLRGHTGPLLSVTGPSENQKAASNSNLLFTAGDEGCIRVWNVPSVSEVNVYGDTKDGANCCIGNWSDEDSREAIWDLKYHPFRDLLLSISANGSVLVWNCSGLYPKVKNQGKVVNRKAYASSDDADQIPTSCAWLETQQNQFVVGYSDSSLAFFDQVEDVLCNAVSLDPQGKQQAQINTLVSHTQTSLVFSGHEDGSIKLFDFQTSKLTTDIASAHKDALSSLSLNASGMQLVSACQSGVIKVWDLRKLGSSISSDASATTPLCTLESGHQSKYNECILGLAVHPTMPFLVSSGADSLVKVYEMVSA
jgi:striatin 1/3/4